MTLILRQAASFDMDAVETLMRTNGRATAGLRDDRSVYWICEDGRNGAAVGCVGLETEGASGLLRAAALVPARRRTGLDQELVACVEKAARELRLSRLFAFSAGRDAALDAMGWERATMRDIVEALPNAPRIRALRSGGGEMGPDWRAYVRPLDVPTRH